MLERELERLPKFECSTCDQWASGWCKKYEDNPPEEIRLTGCESWNWDEIPF